MNRRGARPGHPRSTAFLLAQVGARAAALFAARLRELDLLPAHAGALRAIAGNAGISQQALAALLGTVPSRLVTLIDELEAKGLVERRDHPEDRRVYAIHLTARGAGAMTDIGRVARAHDDDVLSPLDAEERELLHAMLSRIADEQKLTPGVHPGFALLPDPPVAKDKGGAASGRRAGRGGT
jgi:DNA-binding MarR family transcriptional regulator